MYKEEWLLALQVTRWLRDVFKRHVSASQGEGDELDYVSEIEAMDTRFHIRGEIEL